MPAISVVQYIQLFFLFSCFSYVGKADPEYYGIKPQPIFLSFNCFSTVSLMRVLHHFGLIYDLAAIFTDINKLY